jgi:hypothetical protein
MPQQDIQNTLFELVKQRIVGQDTIGNALAEVLSLSSDAVYRRYRGETALTINEIKKICLHYNISFDALCSMEAGNVTFTYPPLNTYDFSLETYLEGILRAFEKLKSLGDPQLIISVNNTPFFQLLNFPQLVRFKLYFWAKTHLMIPAYQNEKFKHEKTSERAFELGRDILQIYNSIPSQEIYDPQLLQGFIRQIVYYCQAHHFEDPQYALFLCDRLKMMSAHIREQASLGKKFIYGTQAPASGNDFAMFNNEIVNTDASFYFTSSELQGVYLTHNVMNYLQTTNKGYVEDTKQILDKQIANSSIISVVNEKERNNYFHELDRTIDIAKKKIEASLF